MKASNKRKGIFRSLRGFARDQRGISAIEFAFVFPVMAALFLGGTALTQGIVIKRKVTLTTRTLGDLASQYACLSDAQMSTIFTAAAAVIQPYPLTTATFTITSVNIDKDGNATVEWSDKEVHGGARETGYPVGQTVTNFPDGVKEPLTHIIMVEGAYTYTPPVGTNYIGTLPLSETFYLRPRRVTAITRQAAACSS